MWNMILDFCTNNSGTYLNRERIMEIVFIVMGIWGIAFTVVWNTIHYWWWWKHQKYLEIFCLKDVRKADHKDRENFEDYGTWDRIAPLKVCWRSIYWETNRVRVCQEGLEVVSGEGKWRLTITAAWAIGEEVYVRKTHSEWMSKMWCNHWSGEGRMKNWRKDQQGACEWALLLFCFVLCWRLRHRKRKKAE